MTADVLELRVPRVDLAIGQSLERTFDSGKRQVALLSGMILVTSFNYFCQAASVFAFLY